MRAPTRHEAAASRPPRARSPFAAVLRDVPADEMGAAVDWTHWYLDESGEVAESCEQGDIIRNLLSSLNELARWRGWKRIYLGADNYFAWVRKHPLVRVSPDAYLVDDPPTPLPRSWQTWLSGHRPPRWAVEIVSEDWKKDYRDAPAKYAMLGCSELVVFDPEATRGETRSASGRVPLTVFRRGEDAAFVEAYSGRSPAFSKELDCWLQARREGYAARLRLSFDEAGEQTVPTADEARTEAERTRAEAERTRADAERTRAKAEERAAKLEARLRELKGSRSD
jgi:Uma2 family endonuclease